MRKYDKNTAKDARIRNAIVIMKGHLLYQNEEGMRWQNN